MAKLDPTQPLTYENVTVQEYGQTVFTPKMVRDSIDNLRTRYSGKNPLELVRNAQTMDELKAAIEVLSAEGQEALEEDLWNS